MFVCFGTTVLRNKQHHIFIVQGKPFPTGGIFFLRLSHGRS